MFITRECDYAIRVLRSLYKNGKLRAQGISEQEKIGTPITYKVLRKLEQAGIIQSYRGSSGGYEICAPLNRLTLYDVCLVIDRDLVITECMKQGYECEQNPANDPCRVHKEFCRIQAVLNQELKKRSLLDILEG